MYFMTENLYTIHTWHISTNQRIFPLHPKVLEDEGHVSFYFLPPSSA